MGALLNLALKVDFQAQTASVAINLSTRQVEDRLAQAMKMLQEVPSRRAAYIAGEESEGFVPVTVVIRTAEGLVTGELPIPKHGWDPTLFLRFLQDQDERLSA